MEAFLLLTVCFLLLCNGFIIGNIFGSIQVNGNNPVYNLNIYHGEAHRADSEEYIIDAEYVDMQKPKQLSSAVPNTLKGIRAYNAIKAYKAYLPDDSRESSGWSYYM